MTIERIRKAAVKAKQAHAAAEVADMKVQSEVADFISSQRGSLRDLAKKLGFTVAYMCDVRYGRRKISAEMLSRLDKMA